MVRLDVMELFVADHLLHGAFVFLRYAAVDQLVQNRQHFIPPHGAAFKQNLAHGQNLAVAQAHRLCVCQPVAARRAVINHVLRQHFIGEERAQRFQIALDAARRNAEFLRQKCLFSTRPFRSLA